MTPKGHMVIRGHYDLLYDPKNDGDHLFSIWRGRRDLLYEPKGQGDLFGRFDLVYDP